MYVGVVTLSPVNGKLSGSELRTRTGEITDTSLPLELGPRYTKATILVAITPIRVGLAPFLCV